MTARGMKILCTVQYSNGCPWTRPRDHTRLVDTIDEQMSRRRGPCRTFIMMVATRRAKGAASGTKQGTMPACRIMAQWQPSPWAIARHTGRRRDSDAAPGLIALLAGLLWPAEQRLLVGVFLHWWTVLPWWFRHPGCCPHFPLPGFSFPALPFAGREAPPPRAHSAVKQIGQPVPSSLFSSLDLRCILSSCQHPAGAVTAAS